MWKFNQLRWDESVYVDFRGNLNRLIQQTKFNLDINLEELTNFEWFHEIAYTDCFQ